MTSLDIDLIYEKYIFKCCSMVALNVIPSSISDHFDGSHESLEKLQLEIVKLSVKGQIVSLKEKKTSDNDIYEFENHTVIHGLGVINKIINLDEYKHNSSKSILAPLEIINLTKKIDSYRTIFHDTNLIIKYFNEFKEDIKNLKRLLDFRAKEIEIIDRNMKFLSKKVSQFEGGYEKRYKFENITFDQISECLKEPSEIINLISDDKKIVFDKELKDENSYYICNEFKSIHGERFVIPGIFIDVVRDLVFNSIKYSDKGKHTYLVIDQTENNINIKVIDQGKGIEKINILKNFEKGVSEKKNGSGLGLSKAYHVIVKKFSGEISLKTKEGIGTYFDINIPYNKDEKGAI